MARKLYVGNLPYDTDEQALQTLFAGAGTVETVSVMRDMATGRARGFAFVEMASDDEAQKAIKVFEVSRNSKRRELFAAQDRIDAQRDELISRIEEQMQQRHDVTPLFTIRWILGE